MVASRQVEIPFYRGNDWQRGRGFSERVQVTERTAIPFLRKGIVSAANCVGVDLMEFAEQENSEVVSGWKKIKTAVKSVGRQSLRKRLGSGSKENSAGRAFQKKLQNKPVVDEEIFLQTFLINQVQQFSVPNF